MTHHEANRQIKHWDTCIGKALGIISLAYEDQLFKNAGQYQGLTKKTIEECRQNIIDVLNGAAKIKRVIDEAIEIEKGVISLFPQQDKLKQIDQLLNGNSIVLENAGISLLAATHTTLQDMLAETEKTFQKAQAALEKVTQTMAKNENLAVLACAAVDALPESLQHKKTEILETSALLLLDPLGAIPNSVKLEQLLKQIERAQLVDKETAEIKQFCQAKLIELRELLKLEKTTQENLIEKVAGAQSLSHEQPVARLQKWLNSIDSLPHQNASLKQWIKDATQSIIQIQQQIALDQTKLDRRQELKGRLNAFRAKSGNLKRNETSLIQGLLQNIEKQLQRPSNLDVAEALLGELAQKLNHHD